MNKAEVLKDNMVPWDIAPVEARRVAQELSGGPDGNPVGISIHPTSGRWYVIQLNPMDTKIVWEEEGLCEACNGSIDDTVLGNFRCNGGPPDVTLGMPRLCDECFYHETMEDEKVNAN